MFALVSQTVLKILSLDEHSSQFPGENEFVLIGRAVRSPEHPRPIEILCPVSLEFDVDCYFEYGICIYLVLIERKTINDSKRGSINPSDISEFFGTIM
jgi:hypothetical protein